MQLCRPRMFGLQNLCVQSQGKRAFRAYRVLQDEHVSLARVFLGVRLLPGPLLIAFWVARSLSEPPGSFGNAQLVGRKAAGFAGRCNTRIPNHAVRACIVPMPLEPAELQAFVTYKCWKVAAFHSIKPTNPNVRKKPSPVCSRQGRVSPNVCMCAFHGFELFHARRPNNPLESATVLFVETLGQPVCAQSCR